MAITGYEQDQVMVNPVSKPGENPDQDVSVPINWAYNHHYMAWMTGAYSTLERLPSNPDDVLAHGSPRHWAGVDTEAAAFRTDPSAPTSQMFSEGNGGESRKSFHGYPNGFAQLIDSPETWHITPMQIDTRNRDCGATPASIHNCTKFTPGPEPKQARYGFGTPKDTNYSGILECPCNGRFGGDPGFYGSNTKTKDLQHSYSALGEPKCNVGEAIKVASDCFEAGAVVGVHATSIYNVSISDPKLPVGCSAVAEKDGTVTVNFNTAKSTAACSTSPKREGQATSDVGVTLKVSLDATAGHQTMSRLSKGSFCSQNRENVIKAFVPKSSSISDAEVVLKQCEEFCQTSSSCQYCSVDCKASPTLCQWVALPTCGAYDPWAGKIAGDVSVKTGGVATITVSGPSDVWFGVGFNAHQMSDQPYTIVTTPTKVFEQKIGTCGSEADHCPGTLLNTSIKILSNTVTDGLRTVVATRPFNGLDKDHYTFSTSSATVPFITAVGSTPDFSYHKAHAPAVVSLLAAEQATCLCDVGAIGKMCDNNGQQCDSFVKTCVGPPAGSLLEQNNPTCNSRQYGGGLRCCKHKRIMLDADQEIRPELLRYHMKFRFWYQEYTPANATAKASHNDLPRIYQQTEANAGEYDVPPAFAKSGIPIPGYDNWPLNKPTPGTTCTGTCPDGPDCSCVHEIHYKWNVGPMRLIYAGGHCHAPSCLSIELYRNDTGELLCRQLPKIGGGNVTHDKYDEAGYIALPPCLWGDDEGLEPSILLPANTPLLSIKKNVNTHLGHFGEMASWQARGTNF